MKDRETPKLGQNLEGAAWRVVIEALGMSEEEFLKRVTDILDGMEDRDDLYL